MKFYVYQDLENAINWSNEKNGDKQTPELLNKDLKFWRLYALGEFGEQKLKLVNKNDNIALFTGNAPVNNYGELTNFNWKCMPGNASNDFSYFIPAPSVTLLKNEFKMYKKIADLHNYNNEVQEDFVTGGKKLREAIFEHYGHYFEPYATANFSCVGNALCTYFINAANGLHTLSVDKIANDSRHTILFDDIKSVYSKYLNN